MDTSKCQVLACRPGQVVPDPAVFAMASAFAIGQIVGPVGVSYTIGSDGGFSRPLAAAAVVLCSSAWALTRGAR